MGLSFSNSTIEDLKSQINIVDVVGRVVTLKRAGANHKGVCPFHNEKTPSFVVSEQKQIFTCFGCGATGDAIGFVMKYYNLDFNEAVERLANEYGITIKRNHFGEDREKYYEINKEAARFFYRAFTEQKNAGYTYMRNRGISDATLKKFGIGYADEKWDSLYNYFKEKGIEEKILLELGLISESKGKYYDKFRNRVMFPIINTSGKVIGFGGRAIGDDTPKYLNSPENKVFQKKNNLYALNTTKQDIGKEGYAILVEGYMDAISLFQGGVRNVIASLGTALTENQTKLIKRYTRQVILSYDADSAGQNAAMRGIEILTKEGCKVRVLHVTDGKDPDEYIKKNGRDGFLALIDEALPHIDYKLNFIKKDVDITTEEGKIDFVKSAAKLLANLSPVEADVYIKKIAKELKIAEGAIKMEILGNNTVGHNGPSSSNRQDRQREMEGNALRGKRAIKDESDIKEINLLEANLLKTLLMSPILTEKLLDYDEVIASQLGRKVVDILFELYGLHGDFHLEQVLDRLDPEESESLQKSLDGIVICANEEQVFEECINTWRCNQLAEREQDLILRLSLADEENNEDAINQLTMELMKVQNEIKVRGGRT
ncbi:MAG: DNA primase [Firmicutes bacterium]|nr:DNA primase [Bacillota bacterium]